MRKPKSSITTLKNINVKILQGSSNITTLENINVLTLY